MGLIRADFPGGQHGLYGRDESLMVSGGVYAAIYEDSTGQLTLEDDPDFNVGSTGTVLYTYAGGSAISEYYLRFAYPTPAYTQGWSGRVWIPSLPESNSSTPYLAFCSSGNSVLVGIRFLSNGGIEARTARNNAGTQYGETANPPLTAGAWKHVEVKVFSDSSAGTIEVRVEGNVVLDLDTLDTDGSLIGQIRMGAYSPTTSPSAHCYWKDVVFWDTSGSEVNDFIGSVGVYDLHPDGDDTLNWNTSRGSTGYNLIDDNKPANTLTSSGAISATEQVRIDSTYYEWTAGSVDTGSPDGSSGNPWLVNAGASAADAIENLFKAIGATGTEGTDYSTGLTAHSTVTADGYSATALDIEATDGLTTNITCTETGSNLSWLASTLNKRNTDNSWISADDTPPDPSIFTMTDLPQDVTSITGIFMIGRMVKTDGGDCDMQMALSPNGTDWDTGTDRSITVASTWWWDASHLSPDTSSPWTPAEVDSLEFRIDRTL